MGELIGFRIERVAEPHSRCQTLDGVLVPGQEMPSFGGARASILPDVQLLFCGGKLRRIVRVDTNRDDVELVAGVEGQIAQAVRNAIQDQRAKHWATVIDESKDDGFASEEFAQLD